MITPDEAIECADKLDQFAHENDLHEIGMRSTGRTDASVADHIAEIGQWIRLFAGFIKGTEPTFGTTKSRL